MKGKRIVDTYALMDHGSMGTYIVENIATSIDLKTNRKFNMNVQFLSASKSPPVSLTKFPIVPYADNGETFSVQNTFCTDKINLPQLKLTNLTQSANPHLTCVTSSSRISIADTSEYSSELLVYPSPLPLMGSEGLPTTLVGSEPNLVGPLLAISMFPEERNDVHYVLSIFATANLSPEQSLSATSDVNFLDLLGNIEKTAAEPQVHHTLNE